MQLSIAADVRPYDDNDWHPAFSSSSPSPVTLFVAGVDVSFPVNHTQPHSPHAIPPPSAVGTITVVELHLSPHSPPTTQLVLSHSQPVHIDVPYIPGFLAFREAPVVTALLRQLEPRVRHSIHCLLLDGNGQLHPRKSGLACHVGVEHQLPTIGVSKSLLCVDGLNATRVRRDIASHPLRHQGVDLRGLSDFVWAKAMLTGNATNKPIYVSVGHRVSLATAARVVKALSNFRIPDPIRYADMHSRAFLRGQPVSVYQPERFPPL